ncbi:MAG: SprT-like domain-containing protein [Schleiferiaceae bacterium]|nr:SprT-like domain-containing protein [Schleiferiaceae bacterium]
MASVYDPIRRFIPEAAGDTIIAYLEARKPKINVKGSRKSKLGDYRRPRMNGGAHIISINNNLSKDQFLITLTHEIAHLDTFVQFGNRCKPHGIEWKTNYQKLMQPFLENQAVFEEDLRKVLIRHMQNPTASSMTSPALREALSIKMREPALPAGHYHLEALPKEAHFFIANKVMIKGDLKRTRYSCFDAKTGLEYSVHPKAPVIPFETQNT